jgi:hypothetical protein
VKAAGAERILQILKIVIIAHGDGFSPYRITSTGSDFFAEQSVLKRSEFFVRLDAQEFHECIEVNDAFPLPGALNFVVTTDLPLLWMLNGTGPNHIQINVGNTTRQMAVGLHSRSVISIFPESAFAIFPGVEFLGGSSCD